MKLEEFRKKAKNMLFFTKSELRMLEPNKHTLDLNLKYWMKSGEIIQLKRGMYILKDRWERERDIDGYREYLANQMMRPSYLSGEYVMQAHALLTEAVYGVSSVTVKKTVAFSNPLGHFQYYSITPTLSLPKEWINKNGLKKGELILLEEDGNFIKISPLNIKQTKNDKEINIEFDGDLKKLNSELAYAYIDNYKVINIT